MSKIKYVLITSLLLALALAVTGCCSCCGSSGYGSGGFYLMLPLFG